MPVTTFIYQNKTILHVDCRGVTSQPEMLVLVNELKSFLDGKSEKILVLTDVTGAYMGLDLMKELKGMNKYLEEKIEKDAILGLDAFKMILVNGWNKISALQVRAFNDQDRALAYLVA